MPSTRIAVSSVLGFSVAGLMLVAMGSGPGPRPGDPLPGLNQGELARFNAGRAAFEEEEFAADGLGPVFTENACAKCHSTPAVGGGSTIVEMRIGRRVAGVFDPLVEFGGPIIQNQGIGQGTGYNGPYDFAGEVIPPQATVRAGRRSTPLFGLGLVEAVPDETFWRMAELQRLLSPETAGRPHVVRDLATGEPAVGRFGWKAQLSTLFDFAGDAYANEMGITTPLVPHENAPQGSTEALLKNPLPYLLPDGTEVPNEPDNEDLVLFSDFMRFLAPPPRGGETRQVRSGAVVFASIGCASCHLPALRTGPSPVRALSHITFHPFSDFLLHDMGSLGDGIEQGDATGREMRTAPLWGVSVQTSYLHDGRAATLEEAILAHDGQARASRIRFSRLNAARKRALIAFLNSL
ncbi:MAG: hypothetical protein KatS3mg108_0668 [Isosphaeraceae bacterium]|nr:MAG: hypothetical protein KatS3mg108_0668 [Isosphaeraceae bacterium]